MTRIILKVAMLAAFLGAGTVMAHELAGWAARHWENLLHVLP